MSSSKPFPSLLITHHGLVAKGGFAEAQAAFLEPDPASVERLRSLLREHKVGIVAHFYMDPELQGVIAKARHVHSTISDSLVMADRAVDMVKAGAKCIVVLGVDFMAENVRAVLNKAGFATVPVYRVASSKIDCSLAAAAESDEYLAWLDQARKTPRSLHVVYINTSLVTKAKAHRLVPTMTCTSSNVVKTVLSAFAQIPNLHLWFGPDTYMGENLRALIESLAELSPSEIAKVHASHNRETLRDLLTRYHYFSRGNCIVHHLFGDHVASQVKRDYEDAYVTAHLEVPGAMFRLALQAQREGRGVVGSTSDILGFVGRTVDEAVEHQKASTLRFVLGTETGMVTSLVQRIRAALERDKTGSIEVEIVFPVADGAVATTNQPELPIVPGVVTGEGCSIEGGCATCPYMKMNSLEALFSLLSRLDQPETLNDYAPRMQQGTLGGRSLVDWAIEPILHMRSFSQEGQLPSDLVSDVLNRA